MTCRGTLRLGWVLACLIICDGQMLDTFMERTIAVCPDASCQGECFRARDESHSCYCDELCEVYSDCCYDFWKLCKNETFLLSNHMDILADRFVCRSIAGSRCDVSIKMVNNCPINYTNDEVMQKCKSTYLEYLFPVIGQVNGYIYANKFCAQCSGENPSNLLQFPAKLKCPDDESVVSLLQNISSGDEKRWIELQSKCQHNITIPEQFTNKVRFCSSSRDYGALCESFDKNVFQSVSEFKAIQWGCLSYQGFVRSTYSSDDNKYLHYGSVYRNSHCAICNGVYPSRHNITCPSFVTRRKRQICYRGPDEISGPSFTVLLDIGNDYTTNNVNSVLKCPDGHTLNIDSKTCSIACPAGYQFSEGHCLVVNKENSFLSFSVGQNWDSDIKTLDQDKLLHLLKANELYNFTVNNVSAGGQQFVEISQSRYNESKDRGESRKTLSFCLDVINETLMINNMGARLVLAFNFTSGGQVDCQDWQTFTGQVPLHSTIKNDSNSLFEGVYELLDRKGFHQFELNVSILKMNITNLVWDWSARLCGETSLTCPLILVVDSYIELLNETHLHLSSGETINSVHFTKINDQVFVCEELLASPITFSKPFFTLSLGNNLVHYYMTIVGLSLSVSGLFLTLAVYLILEPLRTVPGKILMNLNLALLAAQLMFLIGADKTQSHVVCLIIGTLEHYLWLVAFLWMNVISIDLAKTFVTSSLQCHDDRGRSLLLRYTLYSWGLPAVHVTICFLFDYFDVVPDETLTYSSMRACFLSGYKGMLYAFVLPLTVIMAINLFCFAAVTIMLAKASSLEKKIQTNRIKTNQLYLSAKLIPITGLTWIFGVVATLGRVSFLWHPFIVLNSLQGVFVFCGFVFNRRVKRMLKMKMSSISSDTSETANSRL